MLIYRYTKVSFISVLLFFGSWHSICQTGTSGDPFTTIDQALSVSGAGIYHFNLGGTAFSTQVDANGFIQVAIDFGNGSGNLPQVTSLTTSARGILNAATLAKLTDLTEVRITSSTGALDVTSSNATILSRLLANSTFHLGTADNAINNGWTGTGASSMTNNATGSSSAISSLHRKIYHPSGNTNTFHWQPHINQQRELHSSGEVANTVFFQMWIRDNSSPLPVELMSFDAKANSNQVDLTWQTATEINNDYFIIERSINGADWNILGKQQGTGNSSSVITYSMMDEEPFQGVSYYRLKQVDFDGQYEYSQIRSVNFESGVDISISVYPNPAQNEVRIEGSISELENIRIYDVAGKEVTIYVSTQEETESSKLLNISELSSGIYYIKTKSSTTKIVKQN